MQVMTWIPQNDLLAHPKTRAFMSHVGINSLYEARISPFKQLVAAQQTCPKIFYIMRARTTYCLQAAYHGQPIVALPCFGDQFSNADKVVAKVCRML